MYGCIYPHQCIFEIICAVSLLLRRKQNLCFAKVRRVTLWLYVIHIRITYIQNVRITTEIVIWWYLLSSKHLPRLDRHRGSLRRTKWVRFFHQFRSCTLVATHSARNYSCPIRPNWRRTIRMIDDPCCGLTRATFQFLDRAAANRNSSVRSTRTTSRASRLVHPDETLPGDSWRFPIGTKGRHVRGLYCVENSCKKEIRVNWHGKEIEFRVISRNASANAPFILRLARFSRIPYIFDLSIMNPARLPFLPIILRIRHNSIPEW